MPDLKPFVDARKKMAEFTGEKYKVKKPARVMYPLAIERSYARRLIEMVNFLNSLIVRNLFANLEPLIDEAKTIRADDYVDSLDGIIETIQTEFGDRYSEETIRAMAANSAKSLSDFNRGQLTRILSNALGVDVFFTEPYLEAEGKRFVSENVDLITSIPTDHLREVKMTVNNAIAQGKTTRETIKEINKRWGDVLKDKPKNRARLIARDQSGKFYGRMNQLRQTEIGVDKYRWRTVRDERVRESHRVKDGKIFSWNKPPADTGHPGEDYQCRCVAEPLLDIFE
jgi:SPP1 gp7 family putative phage head morphogenesis protein